MRLHDYSPMPFGGHKGKIMERVPADYLLWLWDDGLFDAKALRDRHDIRQDHISAARLAVHEYIKRSFHALETEAKNYLIQHPLP